MEANNLPSRAAELTQQAQQDASRFFNNYFQPTLNTTTDVDAAIQSYFETVTGDTESARLITAAVVYTSLAQNNNPMSVLADFKKLPIGEIDAYLAAFLNLNRVNTSLLGLVNQPKANFFVQRSILA
jgi:hypothetical protein